MLTKTQFIKYANKEMLCYGAKNSLKVRYERILAAYDEMLLANGSIELDYENKIHTDVIADIAQLHARYSLMPDFYLNADMLYEWSINYTKTCIEHDLKPSSVAAARFINRLPSQIVATLGDKIPVQDPD